MQRFSDDLIFSVRAGDRTRRLKVDAVYQLERFMAMIWTAVARVETDELIASQSQYLPLEIRSNIFMLVRLWVSEGRELNERAK